MVVVSIPRAPSLEVTDRGLHNHRGAVGRGSREIRSGQDLDLDLNAIGRIRRQRDPFELDE